jgi:hypothetical protein
MFTFAPDTRIKEHPVSFGAPDGRWTAVTGWSVCTFAKPMAIGGAQSIPPAGKAYRIPMATIGRWGKDGIMFEEYWHCDNVKFMKQIGLAKEESDPRSWPSSDEKFFACSRRCRSWAPQARGDRGRP